MRPVRHLPTLLVASFAIACSSSAERAAPPDTYSAQLPTEVEVWKPPVHEGPCEAGDEPTAAGCVAPGVRGCAQGFTRDGAGGCLAVLPSDPCPFGTMAVPGESACREVAPCGAGTWGDIPVDASTQFVDASYTGGASDGTQSNPWTTIQAGVTAAAPGATVAIAAGTYAEAIVVTGKAVSVRGRCPSLVRVTGTASLPAVIAYASNTLVDGLGIDGAFGGVIVSDAKGVVLDHLWIRGDGTTLPLVTISDQKGPAEATLRRSLVEDSLVLTALAAQGSELTVEGSVVRAMRAGAGEVRGRGIQVWDGKGPGKLTLRGSVVERVYEAAVASENSRVVVEGSVLRDTMPLPGSVGFALSVASSGSGKGYALVRGSILERSSDQAISLASAELVMDDTVVRDTLAGTGNGGIGLVAQPAPSLRAPSMAWIRSSVFERSGEVGLFIQSSAASISKTIVRDTRTRADGKAGFGVFFSNDILGQRGRSWGEVRHSRIEGSHSYGLVVLGADVNATSIVVERTLTNGEGMFGDGVVVGATPGVQSSRLSMTHSRVSNSARAGLANYSSFVALGDSDVVCNGLDLNGETFEDADGERFVDQGGNACGCAPDLRACRSSSATLGAPRF